MLCVCVCVCVCVCQRWLVVGDPGDFTLDSVTMSEEFFDLEEISTWWEIKSTDDRGGVVFAIPPIEKYVWALYWTFTTMTTLGYGDISPNNNNEILFMFGVMIVGDVLGTKGKFLPFQHDFQIPPCAFQVLYLLVR